ncbi:MAG TPA: hypothetical protein VMF14_16835 [Solirubrobacteraceae bacterium]|nr:hypothetical protein [Solirubrobacteraceae bacterium]
MLSDDTLERDLRGALHDLVGDVDPDPHIGDVVLAHHARSRRRSRAARGAGALAAMIAVAGLVVALTAGQTSTPGQAQLTLAAFHLRLPAHSRVLAPGSHICLPAIVSYPGTSVPSDGPTNPTESKVVSAATGDGGCVSVLLTAPFTPGSASAPTPFNDANPTPVTIAGFDGTIGTVTWQGGDMTYDGVSIPDGTTQSELTLQVPAAGGQVEDLVFAAEGLSRQQLVSIVSSGLSAPQAKR